MKMYVFVFVLSVLVAVGQSTKVDGPCPIKIKQIETIDLNRYLGKWYDIYTGSAGYGCAQTKCRMPYYDYYDEDYHSIVIAYYFEDEYGRGTCTNTLWQSDYDVDARLFYDEVDYHSYYVLDTDYDSYAVEIECLNDDGLTHEEQVVLRSRNMTMEDDVRDKLVKKIVDYGFAEPDLVAHDLTGCEPFDL